MGSLVNGSFVNVPDGKAEIVVGTGGGTKTKVSVFEVSGATPARVQTFFPFTALNPNFLGGVSLDVARIDADGIPDIIAGMGVNGTSRIEVWTWNTATATLALLGAIPDAFTGPSNNAPVRVAAMDTDGDDIADAIFAVQGPIGTTGEVHRFDITSTSPFTYQQADPLTGFPGPWFIATSKSVPSGPVPQPGPAGPAPAITVWTNPDNPHDVNNEGFVTPLDALETINHINTNPGETALPAQQFSPPRFFDTNVDGVITPGDVLVVLNFLNSSAASSGEGEASEPAGDIAAMFSRLGLAASPAVPRSASSTPEGRRDQVLGALDTALVPGAEWFLPEAEEESPLVPRSTETRLDDPACLTWSPSWRKSRRTLPPRSEVNLQPVRTCVSSSSSPSSSHRGGGRGRGRKPRQLSHFLPSESFSPLHVTFLDHLPKELHARKTPFGFGMFPTLPRLARLCRRGHYLRCKMDRWCSTPVRLQPGECL